MYGLINKALKDMIRERFGEEQWQAVLSASGAQEDSFLAMRNYDDSITYSLAQAASEVLDAPLDTCLEMFGEYWVLETATKSYEILLNAAGQDLVEFLTNLNALHDRITSTFLNYSPPEFSIEEKEDHHLVHYVSQREGLTPFVVGLLKGLAIRFGREIDILSQTEVDVNQGAHTIFEIKLS
jgi:guanylate cyclase soluble subunit beta